MAETGQGGGLAVDDGGRATPTGHVDQEGRQTGPPLEGAGAEPRALGLGHRHQRHLTGQPALAGDDVAVDRRPAEGPVRQLTGAGRQHREGESGQATGGVQHGHGDGHDQGRHDPAHPRPAPGRGGSRGEGRQRRRLREDLGQEGIELSPAQQRHGDPGARSLDRAGPAGALERHRHQPERPAQGVLVHPHDLDPGHGQAGLALVEHAPGHPQLVAPAGQSEPAVGQDRRRRGDRQPHRDAHHDGGDRSPPCPAGRRPPPTGSRCRRRCRGRTRRRCPPPRPGRQTRPAAWRRSHRPGPRPAGPPPAPPAPARPPAAARPDRPTPRRPRSPRRARPPLRRGRPGVARPRPGTRRRGPPRPCRRRRLGRSAPRPGPSPGGAACAGDRPAGPGRAAAPSGCG